MRLIPAHAGKTGASIKESLGSAAHPRSRGENPSVDCTAPNADGSSPLTRGKQHFRHVLSFRLGLIPAHAGKTARATATPSWRPAHPRSRGENSMPTPSALPAPGSSPLTRGKQDAVTRADYRRRLIPAHAGKTESGGKAWNKATAHPRSRGENPRSSLRTCQKAGSSPLTRGKQIVSLDKVTP